MTEAPAALRLIEHRPDPQKRPKRVQGEQAHPTCGMDRVLMGVAAPLGDLVGHVVDGNDPVKQGDHHEDQKPECEIVEEGVKIDLLPGEKHAPGNDQGAEDDGCNHPLSKPNE